MDLHVFLACLALLGPRLLTCVCSFYWKCLFSYPLPKTFLIFLRDGEAFHNEIDWRARTSILSFPWLMCSVFSMFLQLCVTNTELDHTSYHWLIHNMYLMFFSSHQQNVIYIYYIYIMYINIIYILHYTHHINIYIKQSTMKEDWEWMFWAASMYSIMESRASVGWMW